MSHQAINFKNKLSLFDEQWSPNEKQDTQSCKAQKHCSLPIRSTLAWLSSAIRSRFSTRAGYRWRNQYI